MFEFWQSRLVPPTSCGHSGLEDHLVSQRGAALLKTGQSTQVLDFSRSRHLWSKRTLSVRRLVPPEAARVEGFHVLLV